MKSVHWGRLAVAVACVSLTSQAVVRYVNVNSTSATPPFTNWSSAAVTILVTNGIYATDEIDSLTFLTGRRFSRCET